MFSNIYEVPKVAMSARYKGAGRADEGERVEQHVDIYESADVSGECNGRANQRGETSCVCHQHRQGAHAQKHHPWTYRDSTMVLGFICLVLTIAIFILCKLYHMGTKQHEIIYEKNSPDWCNNEWKNCRCSCYFTSSEKKSWQAGRDDCRSKDADLVLIDSRDENEFLRELIDHEGVWIGLFSVPNPTMWNREWEWEWLDKLKRSYMPWAQGNVVPPRNGSYVYMDEKATWRQTNNTNKQWMCEKYIPHKPCSPDQ